MTGASHPPELIRIITDTAKRGHINTSEVQSASDVGITRKFSSYFRAAIEGVSDEAALKAVKAVAAKGKRTLRKGRRSLAHRQRVCEQLRKARRWTPAPR